MGTNDVVAVMLRALRDMVPNVLEVNLDEHQDAVECLHATPSPLVPKTLRYQVLRSWIDNFRPDLVLCLAGGLTFGEHDFLEVNRRVHTVGIALSDPESFPYHGRVFAARFGHYFTTSRASLVEYLRLGVRADLFQHGCYPGFHRPMDMPKRYDVVVVGHAKKDRIQIVNALARRFSVGIWGWGWDGCVVRPEPQVHGDDYLRAICSGRLYISFPRTHSGLLAMKYSVFEATACRVPVLTERFDELAEYFEYESEIVGYSGLEDLTRRIEYYLAHPDEAGAIADAGYRRCLRDHTWHQRWEGLMRAVSSG